VFRALIQAGKVRGFFRLPLDILNAGWEDEEFSGENVIRPETVPVAPLPVPPQVSIERPVIPPEPPKPADQPKAVPEDSSTRVVKLPG
jgi:hypothetical protein